MFFSNKAFNDLAELEIQELYVAKRTAVLNQLYGIYDDFIYGQNVCCKKKCDFCCTRNVTLTTLEGNNIVEYINLNRKWELFERLKINLHKKRFVPKVTINNLAEMVCNGLNPPEEEIDPNWGPCPLLTDQECPIYPVRPFGCRCLVSQAPCRENGYAKLDPFVLTINYLFLQAIEHIDNQGLLGNLTDILLLLESVEMRKNYSRNLLKPDRKKIRNSPIKFLMIPPEHRLRVKPILEEIQKINHTTPDGD
jgi:Fe-S-cluster containining protein